MQNRFLIALLGAAEIVTAPTPLARYLGVVTFRAHKMGPVKARCA
jgi:hypothetical protein